MTLVPASFTAIQSRLSKIPQILLSIDRTGGVTELQNAWDRRLAKSNIMLVLAGSSIDVMEKISLRISSLRKIDENS